VTKTTTGPRSKSNRRPSDYESVPSLLTGPAQDHRGWSAAAISSNAVLWCLVAPGLPDRLPPCCGEPLRGCLAPTPRARPVRHPAPQEAGRGWGQVLGSAGSPDGLGSAGPCPVSQAGRSLTGEAAPPGDHRRSGDAQPLADLGVGDALSRQQKDLGPAGPARPGLAGTGQLAKGGQVVRGNGEGSSIGTARTLSVHQLSNHFRDEPLAGSAGGCSWHARC
jgi:hypothetical protein